MCSSDLSRLKRKGNPQSLLVAPTHVDLSVERVAIRIISARRPSRNEIRQYEEGVAP